MTDCFFASLFLLSLSFPFLLFVPTLVQQAPRSSRRICFSRFHRCRQNQLRRGGGQEGNIVPSPINFRLSENCRKIFLSKTFFIRKFFAKNAFLSEIFSVCEKIATSCRAYPAYFFYPTTPVVMTTRSSRTTDATIKCNISIKSFPRNLTARLRFSCSYVVRIIFCSPGKQTRTGLGYEYAGLV